MYTRFLKLTILYIPSGEAFFASSGERLHSTTPGPCSMVGVDHSTTPGPITMNVMSHSGFPTRRAENRVVGNAYMRIGLWGKITSAQFESWIESEVDDVNKYLISGHTLVGTAVREHRPDLVEFLVSRGANVELTGTTGRTPLLTAVMNKDVDIVRLLLRSGADINRVMYGVTALSTAARVHSTELVNLLIGEGGADLNALMGVALVEAANQGDLEIVDMLLRNGADINQATFSGMNPLSTAAWSRAGTREEVFNFLVLNGANVNHAMDIGRGGIALAVLAGRLDIIEMYLRNGADIHVVDNSGQTLLMMAASNGHLDVVEVLIEQGVDVGAVDNQDRSALDVAIHYLALHPNDAQHRIIVRLLEEAIAERATMYISK